MRDLLPFLRLYRQHWGLLGIGLLLSLFTLWAGIGLLSLSGWFLSAAAIAGLLLLLPEFRRLRAALGASYRVFHLHLHSSGGRAGTLSAHRPVAVAAGVAGGAAG